MSGTGLIERVTTLDSGSDGIVGNNPIIVKDSYMLNNGGFGVSFAHCSSNAFNTNGDADGTEEENRLFNLQPSLCNLVACP